jgi:TonB family protein
MGRDMADNKTLVLTSTFLIVASAGWAAKKGGSVDPESLIAKARSKEILWTEGTPKLALRAELKAANAQGGEAAAQYVFAWASQSQWREEIKFADYDRLRIGSEKGYWQTSNLNYKPEAVFQLDEMLHVKDLIDLSPDETLGKVKHRKKHGVAEDCTDVKNKLGTERTLCFDDSTGALAAVEHPTTGISSIEYSDFHSVAGEILPFEARATNDGRLIASMKVTAVGSFAEKDGALFSVPANAEFWAHCDDMQGAKLAHQTMPVYPTAAKANHEQGTVVFYAVVEADGSVSHLAPIRMATPDLVASAADALRTWRYKPATCDGKPIRLETQISVVFTLDGP